MNLKAGEIKSTGVPLVIWLWLPLFLLVVPFFLKLIVKNEHLYKEITREEYGLIEISTVIFLIITIIFGILILRLSKNFSKWFKTWIILITLASFVFVGEEASWGQHYLKWKTPKFFEKKGLISNIQHETNFHNSRNKKIRLVFKVIPRASLNTIVIVCGIVGPLLLSLGWFNKKSVYYWFLGTTACLPAGLLSFFIGIPEKIFFYNKYMTYKTLGVKAPEELLVHSNESRECMLALFLMIYFWSIYTRTKSFKKITA